MASIETRPLHDAGWSHRLSNRFRYDGRTLSRTLKVRTETQAEAAREKAEVCMSTLPESKLAPSKSDTAPA